jgi:uncharacterized RmlC-like cupin family protein
MTSLPEKNRYHRCNDPTSLRTAINELFNLVVDIDRIIDAAGYPPDAHHPEHIAGLHEAKSMAMQNIRYAKCRLDQLRKLAPAGRPVLVEPDGLPVYSSQGESLSPVVSRPMVAAVGLSSAEVWIPPGQAAHAHVHYDSDVIMLVRDGEAVTMWWDEHGDLHEVHQTVGQHLHIPHGVPHAMLNVGVRPVIASEFHGNAVFDADDHRLDQLAPVVAARLGVVDHAA